MKNSSCLSLSALLFVLCLCIGLFLASLKPLWTDEIYGQKESIQSHSYASILQGRMGEGNCSPLFYLLQKEFCQLVGYRLDIEWNGSDLISRYPDLFILRILPNIFISLSVSAIFYFFLRFYGLWVSLYAFLVTLSSYMVWAYWAEARAYGLWTALTTLQALLFLHLLRSENPEQKAWNALLGIHLLMAFTIPFAMAQIAAVSLLLFLLKERQLVRYISFTFLPCVICLYYYSQSLKLPFWFPQDYLSVIYANFPKDRLAMVATYVLVLGICIVPSDIKEKRKKRCRLGREEIGFLTLTVLMMAAALLVLFIIKLTAVSPEVSGVDISNRYFIFLTPICIISVTLFSLHVLRMVRHNFYLSAGWIILFSLLLLFRFSKTLELVTIYYS